MAFIDFCMDQATDSFTDQFGNTYSDLKAVLTGVRISPGNKTIVIGLGLYTSLANYYAGKKPLWHTGWSFNATEYNPNAAATTADKFDDVEYRPDWDTLRPLIQIVDDGAGTTMKLQVDNVDLSGWFLLFPNPADPTQTLGADFAYTSMV